VTDDRSTHDDQGDVMTEGEKRTRAAGMAKMDEVYGFNVDPDSIAGPYVDVTVDHLFGTIWTREVLDTRDRRMVTIGVLAALGQANLVEIQFRSALERNELTEEQVRELVLHLAHYIGWPLSTGVNAAAEKIIAERAKAAKAAAADTTPDPS
jgi:4-carboxymuconolactone decarboxylase